MWIGKKPKIEKTVDIDVSLRPYVRLNEIFLQQFNMSMLLHDSVSVKVIQVANSWVKNKTVWRIAKQSNRQRCFLSNLSRERSNRDFTNGVF